MTREEAIVEACRIAALVYQSIGDYTSPADCFCGKQDHHFSYENDGHVFKYIRKAVLAQLKKDGYMIAPGFNPETGEELL